MEVGADIGLSRKMSIAQTLGKGVKGKDFDSLFIKIAFFAFKNPLQ